VITPSFLLIEKTVASTQYLAVQDLAESEIIFSDLSWSG
jgi:hypothetical protein